MARELVVPWSRAKRYLGISIISLERSSLLELRAERQMEFAAYGLNYLMKDAILSLFTFKGTVVGLKPDLQI
jgi:hypothetical protein